MLTVTRRNFLKAATAGLAAAPFGLGVRAVHGQAPGERPPQADGVRVLNPQMRVPVSMIVDDSTCLANLSHFAMPQFAETWPGRAEYQNFADYLRKTPREIPDAFVREFGQWCHAHGVKGKFSVVPYPACVGWIDRFLPGWPTRALAESLELVRTLMLPDWDIHPEMVSHTRVIDTRTGRPYEKAGPEYMENWKWTDGKSVDQLADYVGYALKILKNVGLPCEGVTSPGGFGAGAAPNYAQAVLQACRSVFAAEVPHYFLHVLHDQRSVAPRVECAARLDRPDPECVVSIVACAGDWFGGWNAVRPGSPDRFITPDLKAGRMVEVIERGEPAVMVGHWPGIYFNGEKTGFRVLQEVVRRLHARYDNLLWMKLSEISRYWAAKELTRIERQTDRITLTAPFAAPQFTISVAALPGAVPQICSGAKPQALREVSRQCDLKSGTWLRLREELILCFDLPKGRSEVRVVAQG